MEKLAVLIITPDPKKRQVLEAAIRRHLSLPTTLYSARDGAEGQAKLHNAPPQIVITDFQLTKVTGRQLVDGILTDHLLRSCVVMILAPPPEVEIYLDELATGRVQFVHDWNDEKEISHRLVQALNFVSHGENTVFHLRFLAAAEQLIKEGEKEKLVYILKKGKLRAYRNANGQRIDLGDIIPGEFVGEMAYINGEPRSANVEALTPCELVEIPLGTLDKLLYLRPSWAKTLLETLSKRLKQANDRRAAKENH